MEYYSAIKRNETMPFEAMWMDLEIIIVSEVSQTEKDKFHIYALVYCIGVFLWLASLCIIGETVR